MILSWFYFIGAVAQLGERLNGIQEVVGSIPISSTIKQKMGQSVRLALFVLEGLIVFYVYVLRSESSARTYVGQSKDIDNRVAEHNSNKNKATKNKGPWKLVHSEEFGTRSEAVMRERYFKTVAGRIELRELGLR